VLGSGRRWRSSSRGTTGRLVGPRHSARKSRNGLMDAVPFRRPRGCLVLSPYARKGHISKAQHSHVSLVRFCERNFGLTVAQRSYGGIGRNGRLARFRPDAAAAASIADLVEASPSVGHLFERGAPDRDWLRSHVGAAQALVEMPRRRCCLARPTRSCPAASSRAARRRQRAPASRPCPCL